MYILCGFQNNYCQEHLDLEYFGKHCHTPNAYVKPWWAHLKHLASHELYLQTGKKRLCNCMTSGFLKSKLLCVRFLDTQGDQSEQVYGFQKLQ